MIDKYEEILVLFKASIKLNFFVVALILVSGYFIIGLIYSVYLITTYLIIGKILKFGKLSLRKKYLIYNIVPFLLIYISVYKTVQNLYFILVLIIISIFMFLFSIRKLNIYFTIEEDDNSISNINYNIIQRMSVIVAIVILIVTWNRSTSFIIITYAIFSFCIISLFYYIARSEISWGKYE